MAADIGLYQIRNSETGEYSHGGCNPRWSPRGKVWTGMGFLLNHLSSCISGYALGQGTRQFRKATKVELLGRVPLSWVVVRDRGQAITTCRELFQRSKKYKEAPDATEG